MPMEKLFVLTVIEDAIVPLCKIKGHKYKLKDLFIYDFQIFEQYLIILFKWINFILIKKKLTIIPKILNKYKIFHFLTLEDLIN